MFINYKGIIFEYTFKSNIKMKNQENIGVAFIVLLPVLIAVLCLLILIFS